MSVERFGSRRCVAIACSAYLVSARCSIIPAEECISRKCCRRKLDRSRIPLSIKIRCTARCTVRICYRLSVGVGIASVACRRIVPILERICCGLACCSEGRSLAREVSAIRYGVCSCEAVSSESLCGIICEYLIRCCAACAAVTAELDGNLVRLPMSIERFGCRRCVAIACVAYLVSAHCSIIPAEECISRKCCRRKLDRSRIPLSIKIRCTARCTVRICYRLSVGVGIASVACRRIVPILERICCGLACCSEGRSLAREVSVIRYGVCSREAVRLESLCGIIGELLIRH